MGIWLLASCILHLACWLLAYIQHRGMGRVIWYPLVLRLLAGRLLAAGGLAVVWCGMPDCRSPSHRATHRG
jgi:hypothetical protein